MVLRLRCSATCSATSPHASRRHQAAPGGGGWPECRLYGAHSALLKGRQARRPPALDCSKPSPSTGAQNSNPQIELRVMSLLACNDVFQAPAHGRPQPACAQLSIRSNCRGARRTCGVDNQRDIQWLLFKRCKLKYIQSRYLVTEKIHAAPCNENLNIK